MRLLSLLAMILLCTQVYGQKPPTTFDLRDVGGSDYVTSIKSQQGGTCWTHGAMAAIEGNLMMTGAWTAAGESGEPNLAEYHLDWWNGFNKHNNDDAEPPSGGGLIVHEGGDYMVTSAYLSRGEGAVRDLDGQSFYLPPLRSDDDFHYYYPRHIEFLRSGANLENIEAIKNRLMSEGVIATAMCYGGEYMENYIHYQPPTDTVPPNHAVAIIGWDDGLTTQAPEPGAWLCKNSWGEDWGYDGYFWISYYDKACGQDPQMGTVSFRDVEPLTYDHIYYHDYHGWRATLTEYNTAFNAFTAGDDELLHAVSFFTAADSVDYLVRIYDNFQQGELANELATVSGFFEHTGLHTVDLDTPMALIANDDFYISLELSQGGQAYDQTSDVPVLLGAQYRTIVESSAEPGQSFYWNGAGWQDFYEEDSTANFCIKALAIANPKLGFSFPSGLPEIVQPGEQTYVLVNIKNGTEQLVSGSPQLNYRFHGGYFATMPLQYIGPGYYRVDIPAAACAATPEYYFSAQTLSGSTIYCPKQMPDSLFHYEVGEIQTVLQDDFEVNLGWTAENLGASAGDWERGVPIDDPSWAYDPATDADGSGQCYLTDNSYGNSDVDRGSVRLTSPLLDMSIGGNISYYYYLYLSYASDGCDLLLVEGSDDGGANWVEVCRHDQNMYNFWAYHEISETELLATGLNLTASMQFRFTATDSGTVSTVEAALDAFTISIHTCADTYACGDADDNGIVNISDAVYLIAFIFGGGDPPSPFEAGDVDCNQMVNISDAVYLIAYIFGGGPEPCAGCP